MIFLAFAFCLCSCESKERKAYNESVNSRQISQLKQFISDFPEAGELIDSAKIILSEWEKDSMLYIELKQKEDVVERYNQEKIYLTTYPNGLYSEEVMNLMANDEKVAEEAIAKQKIFLAEQEARQNHLDEFRKQLENTIFYSSFEGGRSFIIMNSPNTEGKGMGVWGTTIDGWGGALDEGIKFKYEINMEDFDDDKIICHNVANNSLFTIEIYDDILYVTARGESDRFIGERNVEEYKSTIPHIK